LSLLTLTAASFDYGRETILAGANLALHRDTRYALVGANGAGKTTLLAILAGEFALHGGQRLLAGGVSIGFLRQVSRLGLPQNDQIVLREAVRSAAYAQELALQAEMAEIGRLLAAAPDAAEQAQLISRQGSLQSEFERLEGYTLDARLEAALLGVGLPAALWATPIERLSGGERRRAQLAATLLRHCDLLLLDEPTNHLDLQSCEWLETHLQNRRGTAVIVSHDRWFLDRIAQRTLYLDRGRLTDDVGNYTVFLQVSAERRRQELAAWQRQQDHIRQTEAFIRKNIAGQKTRQAQSRRKQLSRLEPLAPPPAQETGFTFDLRPVRASGGMVLQAEGLTKRYGDRTILQDFDLQVVRGERIGILGPNGCGKTTLLRLLAGDEVPDAGRVLRGYNVDLGRYDQHLQTVSDHLTVLGEMQAVTPGALLVELRTFLGAFGFGEDMIDRPVSSLSGGERGRLALLRLIKSGYNTLLLDEPTNHLDIGSRESLEAALQQYEGTLVVVSHDRRLLDRLVQRLVVFPDVNEVGRGPRIFLGNYGDYQRRCSEERQAAAWALSVGESAPRPRSATKTAPGCGGGEVSAGGRAVTASAADSSGQRPRLSKNEQARRRARIAAIEGTIAALEREEAAALAEMSDPACSSSRRRELGDRCATIAGELVEALETWEQWSAELEGA
jgi:ATP-binding cassette subfamily F protein 3